MRGPVVNEALSPTSQLCRRFCQDVEASPHSRISIDGCVTAFTGRFAGWSPSARSVSSAKSSCDRFRPAASDSWTFDDISVNGVGPDMCANWMLHPVPLGSSRKVKSGQRECEVATLLQATRAGYRQRSLRKIKPVKMGYEMCRVSPYRSIDSGEWSEDLSVFGGLCREGRRSQGKEAGDVHRKLQTRPAFIWRVQFEASRGNVNYECRLVSHTSSHI